MANLYLSSGDNISGLTFGGGVFGSTGNEIVTYANGVNGIVVDQNVEQVRLAGTTSSYTFQQSGNQLLVFSGSTQVARITLQNDLNGTLVSFANGTVEAKVSAAGLTLGGTTVPSAAPATVIPAAIDGTSGTGTQLTNLTVNQDTLVGTAVNDLFIAGGAQDGAGSLINTLQSVDVIDGGEGEDTLRFTDADGDTVAPTLTSIENIEARFTDFGTLDLSSSTGVKNITVSGSTTSGDIDGVGAVENFTVSNDKAGNGIDFNDGTATTATVNVKNVGVVSATAPSQGFIYFDDNAFTALTLKLSSSNVEVEANAATALKSLTVEATGANVLDFVNAGQVETLTVSGAGSLDLDGDTYSGLKTLAAGTATGAITNLTVDDSATSVTLGSGADSITVSTALTAAATVTLGAGNDVLTLGAAPTKGATLTGGDGSDTIALSSANYLTVAGYDTADRAKVSGFEVLSLTTALVNATSYDVSKLSGINSVVTVGAATGGTTATITGLTSGGTVTVKGDIGTNDGTVVVTVKDAALVGSTADVLNVNVAPTVAADETLTLSAVGVETINLSVTDGDAATTKAYTLALTDDALTTLNIAGGDTVVFASAASQSALTTIDASANTAGVTLDLDATVAAAPTLNVTGTAKADVFTLGNDTVVKGNGGNDTFNIGVTTSGQTYSSITDATKGDVVNFAGSDSFVAAKITLAGTAVFQDYLDAATAGNATNDLSWFQFGGNTFIVQDAAAGATFQNGTDKVVALVGTIDLSTAVYAAPGLTFG